MGDIDFGALARKKLNLLIVFDAVVESRSVTAAAVKLNMTQSALSHALGRLRVMLDDPLFIRTRTGLALTAKAASLAGPVRDVLRSLDSLLKPASFDPGSDARAFGLGVCEYSGIVFGRTVASQLEAAAPLSTFKLEIFEYGSERPLTEGGLDIGLWPYAVSNAQLGGLDLFHDRFVGVIHAFHPLAEKARAGALTIDDYLSYPHVQTLVYGARSDEVGRGLERLGLRREIAVSAATFVATFPLLYGSSMIAAVPSAGALAAQTTCYDLLLFELPFELEPLVYRMMWHRRNEHDPGHVWLREQLARFVRAGMVKQSPMDLREIAAA